MSRFICSIKIEVAPFVMMKKNAQLICLGAFSIFHDSIHMNAVSLNGFLITMKLRLVTYRKYHDRIQSEFSKCMKMHILKNRREDIWCLSMHLRILTAWYKSNDWGEGLRRSHYFILSWCQSQRQQPKQRKRWNAVMRLTYTKTRPNSRARGSFFLQKIDWCSDADNKNNNNNDGEWQWSITSY